jgi:hypothetical protein
MTPEKVDCKAFAISLNKRAWALLDWKGTPTSKSDKMIHAGLSMT